MSSLEIFILLLKKIVKILILILANGTSSFWAALYRRPYIITIAKNGFSTQNVEKLEYWLQAELLKVNDMYIKMNVIPSNGSFTESPLNH